jgi:glycosyltransferase involved in cell wall biosynthesis
MGKQKDHLPVSIVIPCYNYGCFLDDAVGSIHQSTVEIPLAQIIIVNDGSTDQNTLDILNSYRLKGYNIIAQVNKGLPAARNTGISAAETDYLLPLDADDMIASTFIEKAFWVLRTRDEIGFVCSWLKHFGDETWVWKPSYSPFRLLFENIVTVTSLIRKKAWDSVGGYDENMKWGYEDWDFWLKLVEVNWQGYQIPEILFYYRRHGKTLLHKSNKNRTNIIRQLRKNHPSLFDEENIAYLKKINRRSYIALTLKDIFRDFIINIPFLKTREIRNFLYNSIASSTACSKSYVHGGTLAFNENAYEIPLYYCKAVRDRRLKILLLVKLSSSKEYEMLMKLIRVLGDKYYLIVLFVNLLDDTSYNSITINVDELFVLPNFLDCTLYSAFLLSQILNKEVSLLVNINLLELHSVLSLIRYHKPDMSTASAFISTTKVDFFNKEIMEKIYFQSDLLYCSPGCKINIINLLPECSGKCNISISYEQFLENLIQLIGLKRPVINMINYR